MSAENPKTRLRWFCIRCDGKKAVPKVEADLKRLGVKTFIPLSYRKERRGGWLVAIPDGYLFPPYIFIAMKAPGTWKSPASILWGAVADIDGVHIMGRRDPERGILPVSIPHEEMRLIRTMERSSQRRKEVDRLKQGQKVRVVGGAFTGFDGIFDRPAKDRVKILLSLFGRQTEVELREDEVRAA